MLCATDIAKKLVRNAFPLPPTSAPDQIALDEDEDEDEDEGYQTVQCEDGGGEEEDSTHPPYVMPTLEEDWCAAYFSGDA